MDLNSLIGQFGLYAENSEQPVSRNPQNGQYLDFTPNEDDKAVYIKFPDVIVDIPKDKSQIDNLPPEDKAAVHQMMIFMAHLEYAKTAGKNVVLTFPESQGGSSIPSFEMYAMLSNLREDLEAKGLKLATHIENPKPGRKGLAASAAVHNFLAGSAGHRTMDEEADILIHGVNTAVGLYAPAALIDHMYNAGHIDNQIKERLQNAKQIQDMYTTCIALEIVRGRYGSLSEMQRINQQELDAGVPAEETSVMKDIVGVKEMITAHIEAKHEAMIALYDAEMEKPESEKFSAEFHRKFMEIDRPLTQEEIVEMGLVDHIYPKGTGMKTIFERLPAVVAEGVSKLVAHIGIDLGQQRKLAA